MIAVEMLYLTALLSGFIGLIALMALTRPAAKSLGTFPGMLSNLIVIMAVVSVSAFFIYALSPRNAARAVYGANVSDSLRG
ncbi:hypothetical protein [Methylocystis echinoides]|jgi:hypothetical protein|uniref:hypothetical protein n=1 Tax=Methylocystis echinoides TaxID=29468 RepID=UPI00342ADAC3